ncbi:MAG: hypothetical protein H0U55_02765 [Rubrobacteraceae bacterium]|nr:hypothetical protein [Rubrobacteraceae bacterium]
MTQQTQQQRREVSPEVLPSDGLSRFVRAGAWAAMVSGLALVVSLLMEWLVVPYERLGQTEAYFTNASHVASGLRLFSIVLLLWGLIGIYGRQSRATGTFGLWTFVVVFSGTALTVGNAWAEVFVWPTLAQVAPNAMTGPITEVSPYLSAGLGLSFPLFGIGLILFGAATFWAGVYPRWAPVLLIVSIPVTIFLDPTAGTFQESIGQILLGIALVALGFYGLRRAPSTTSS